MKIFEKRDLKVEDELDDGRLYFNFYTNYKGVWILREKLTAPETVQLIAKLEARL